MSAYTDFELAIQRWQESPYTIEVTVREPGSAAPIHPEPSDPVTFDLTKLLVSTDSPEAYGQLLTTTLFQDETTITAFRNARAVADAGGFPIRLRLRIGEQATDLDTLRWETLRDPEHSDVPLLTSNRVFFSRYVTSHQREPLPPKPAEQMKALVIIANPSDIGELHDPRSMIDVDTEAKEAAKRLSGFSIEWLKSGGEATFEKLVSALRRGCDVLYLVCHGFDLDGEPRIILEQPDGRMQIVDGDLLIRRFREVSPPRLVILASCLSAGATHTADGRILARLGPRLVSDIGIPAVVAMNGQVTIDTVSKFLEVFFENVREHDEVDRAVAAGRAAIQSREDWWMPVLYMRMPNGRLWKEIPANGKSGAAAAYEQWDGLLETIRSIGCTPFIGFGVYERIFGREDTLAERWAKTYRYPFRDDRRDELPQIAQYLSVAQKEATPSLFLQKYFRNEIISRFGSGLSEAIAEGPLDDLITTVWSQSAASDDPYRVLARLPCNLYLTTNVATTLEAALKEIGVPARSIVASWNAGIVQEDIAKLDKQNPVVFHLFGRLDDPNSIVLTEDNYFDFLMATGSRRDIMIPQPIRTAVNRSALIFLGFQITDWNFRILFRSLLSPDGLMERKKYPHVAVQLDPDVTDPDLVVSYLERYLRREEITIFRGSVDEFLIRLRERWTKYFRADLLSRSWR